MGVLALCQGYAGGEDTSPDKTVISMALRVLTMPQGDRHQTNNHTDTIV